MKHLSPAFLLLALAGIGGYTVLAITLGKGFAIPCTIVIALASTVILRGPVGKALAQRLEGGEAPPEEVLAELDDLRHRLSELEERVDFSERILAKPPAQHP